MISQIAASILIEVFKQVIRELFDKKRQRVKKSEIYLELEKLEKKTDQKIIDFKDQLSKDFFDILKALPHIESDEEGVRKKEGVEKSENLQELKNEFFQTLDEVIEERRIEPPKENPNEKEIQPSELKWDESVIDKPEINSTETQWENELTQTLNNIRSRRLNLE